MSTGRSRRRRHRHRLGRTLLGAIGLGASALPERWALRGGALLGAVAGGVLRLRRRDVDRHLRLAFPERSPGWRRQVARACYRHFGREAVATLRAGAWTVERLRARARLVGFEPFRADAASGGGVLLLTAHLGTWELGGAAIAAHGVPLEVVGKGARDPVFQEQLFRMRERLGMRVIEMGDAPREVLRALRRGRPAALLWDQNAHRGGIFVPFFGRAAATARGPALFAARAGVPVYFAVAIRDAGAESRYTVTFERLPFTPSGNADEDATALAAAYAAALERAVRSAPEQYFWQHRRWKTRPPEEPPSSGQVITPRSERSTGPRHRA